MKLNFFGVLELPVKTLEEASRFAGSLATPATLEDEGEVFATVNRAGLLHDVDGVPLPGQIRRVA